MPAFLTYARPDADAANVLGADLEALGWNVWLDKRLSGGQDWWDEILSQIRAAEVYVFGLSSHSIRSEACLSELHYALATERSILTIRFDDTPIEAAPDRLRRIQAVDLATRSPEAVLALAKAISRISPSPPASKEVQPPPVPESYASRFLARLMARDLPYREQMEILTSLRIDLNSQEDRSEVRRFLMMLRERTDVAFSIANEADLLLAKLETDEVIEQQPQEPPDLSGQTTVVSRSRTEVLIKTRLDGHDFTFGIAIGAIFDRISVNGKVVSTSMPTGGESSAGNGYWVGRMLTVEQSEVKVAYGQSNLGRTLKGWKIESQGRVLSIGGEDVPPNKLSYKW